MYYNVLDTDLFLKWDLHETAQKVIMYGELSSHENFITCTDQEENEEYH